MATCTRLVLSVAGCRVLGAACGSGPESVVLASSVKLASGGGRAGVGQREGHGGQLARPSGLRRHRAHAEVAGAGEAAPGPIPAEREPVGALLGVRRVEGAPAGDGTAR